MTFIVGRIENYSIVKDNPKVVINLFVNETLEITSLHNLGNDTMKFHTPFLDSVSHYQWNRFEIICTDTSGNTAVETLDIYVALGPGIVPLNPPLKTCYGRIDTTIMIKVNFYGDTPLDTIAIFVAPPDSDFKLIAQQTSTSLSEILEVGYELKYEGEYRIKARAVNELGQEAEAVYPFWADTTAPTVLVYEPAIGDSLDYSPLVTDSMPIAIHFEDNLMEVFKQPKDKAIYTYIHKIIDVPIPIWDTMVTNCYYGVEKRFFWKFNGHQGNGKYRVIAQLSDIAGN